MLSPDDGFHSIAIDMLHSCIFNGQRIKSINNATEKTFDRSALIFSALLPLLTGASKFGGLSDEKKETTTHDDQR